MKLYNYFRSMAEQDLSPIVICDLSHTILYMNPFAIKKYENRGGASLVGKSLLLCHNAESCKKIEDSLAWFAKSTDNNRVYTFYNEKENKDVYTVALRDENGELIGYYEKHEYKNRETAQFYDLSN